MMWLRLALYFSTLLAVTTASAADVRDSSLRKIEAKTHLEELIVQRLKSLISTTLSKDDFEVAAQVELIDPPERETTKVSKVNPGQPIDLAVGLIDADALIRKYEADLKESRDRALTISRQITEERYPFIVKSLHIFVGLRSTLGEPYAKELEAWVKKQVASDFGPTPEVNVSLLRAAPEISDSPKSPFDFITKAQFFLGLLALAFSIICSVLLMKFTLSKDASENRKLTAQLQQNMKMQEQETRPDETKKDKAKELLPEPQNFYELEVKLIRELKDKILASLFKSTAGMNEVLRGWLESEERGFYKAASLIDILITAQGGPELRDAQFNLDWSQTVPPAFQKRMRETFERMMDLKANEKIRILEEVYWDLVSLKTLGANALTQPFQYVSAIPAGELKNMLETQQPRLRTLAVLHMNEPLREDYLKYLSYEGKREIVQETLEMREVLSSDIVAASETLKISLKPSQGAQSTVALSSMAPLLLGSLAVSEEIKLLKELNSKMPDAAFSIKRSFPSFAFIEAWPQPFLKLVFASAISDEVVALLRLMPDVREKVLPHCPPRVRDIVADDLGKEDRMSAEEKEQNLTTLKSRLLEVVDREGIRLEEIFKDDAQPEGGLNVAA